MFARTHKHEATHGWFGPIKSLYLEMQAVMSAADKKLALFGVLDSQLTRWSNCCCAGEIMSAVHSIEYDGLCSYYYLFAAFDPFKKQWLAWKVCSHR